MGSVLVCTADNTCVPFKISTHIFHPPRGPLVGLSLSAASYRAPPAHQAPAHVPAADTPRASSGLPAGKGSAQPCGGLRPALWIFAGSTCQRNKQLERGSGLLSGCVVRGPQVHAVAALASCGRLWGKERPGCQDPMIDLPNLWRRFAPAQAPRFAIFDSRPRGAWLQSLCDLRGSWAGEGRIGSGCFWERGRACSVRVEC